eukprot:TRINITY_DN47188_c0_g1_i1.p1 TRINITY_DN47188_c0_g1~~TRINITY_DN47188_c0_g1_i1.p1  ORF type:complete len:661 (-),score=124.70 TRINITY_DN47188_c0_g1_i1:38-1930(-)
MKASGRAFTCLLLPLVWGTKVTKTPGFLELKDAKPKTGMSLSQLKVNGTLVSTPSVCTSNIFPVESMTVQGIGSHKDVLAAADLATLQSNAAALTDPNGHPYWKIGKLWTFSVVATSNEASIEDREFGFDGGEGFLVFKVPSTAVEQFISVTGTVMSQIAEMSFEYRGRGSITHNEAVSFKDFCLRPATCDHFFETNPGSCYNDDYWKRKANPETVFGHSMAECCETYKCAEENPCQPETQYSRNPDYDTAPGYKPESCCLPLDCARNRTMCNNSLWKDKPGSHFGSTPEECCVARDCEEYNCSSSSKWVKKPQIFDSEKNLVLIQGSTDEECCDKVSCKHFNCTLTDKWMTNPNADQGFSLEECCLPLYCSDFTCGPHDEWVPNPLAHLGSSNESCCDPILCEHFTCSERTQLKAGAVQYPRELKGKSEEKCCEVKFCKDWTCSDPSKWIPKSDLTSVDLLRRGWSDEECCHPLPCSAVDCMPETLWLRKNDEELATLQGSRPDQCCTPKYCSDHTCTGDYPSVGVKSTKWYKKRDTNHYRFKGSTDRECCEPKYCSEFFTAYPTKYERKPDDGTRPLQGGTEEECYNELKCIEHCCVDERMRKKANAEQLIGSTDEECCELPESVSVV